MRPCREPQNSVRQAQESPAVGRYNVTARPSVGERGDQIVDLGNGGDVDATRRLVEYDQLGLLDQRLGDHHLLLIAAGKLDDPSGRCSAS